MYMDKLVELVVMHSAKPTKALLPIAHPLNRKIRESTYSEMREMKEVLSGYLSISF